MKKNIILTLALACSTFAMGQSDVTSKYIANPSFEKNGTDGWVASNLATQTNTSFTHKKGNTYLEKWVSSGNNVGSASVSQTIAELEPGKYTLTVAAQNLNQSDKEKKCSGTTIFAGSKTTPVYTPDDYSVDFTYLEGELSIGFKATNATGNWLAVDNFRLTYNGAPDLADMQAVLKTLITEATQLYGDGTGELAAELKVAIDAAQKIVDTADAPANEAVDAWKQLKNSMTEYRKANVSEASPLDCTSYIQNPSFEDNGTKGWTNENMAAQSNTSFTKKKGNVYMEKWVSKGSKVGDGLLSQKISGLPNGVYRLTVAAQNLNQSSTTQKCTGAVIYADDVEEPVYTAKDYELKFTSIAGEVEIGFRAKGASGNWICADNFRLEQIGKIDNSGIVAEIMRSVTKAEALQASMMSSKAATDLQSAIDQGKTINETSSDADVQAAKKALDTAIEAAESSIAEYAALAAAIEAAEATYDASKEGAENYKTAIDNAKALATNPEATSQQLSDEIVALSKASLAFNLANATHGVTIKVTQTNKKVLTGSTEALMRATMTGTALEKGICWSTEHEPTVLDDRTTESHTLNGTIFHARNLKPATVYYLRPYIMSKTYEVVYGDEVKIVTHPKGTCKGTWNEGAPNADANTRCRNAINETIEYFNQWTGIKGFTLTGNYGADTPTADCSYGGWMRIGPNTGNQAIGTVIHETGHGVGVGTSDRWWDENVHSWFWKGREANEIFHFLENRYSNEDGNLMVGDGTHGWGQNATYDWFVNGSDKDRHEELQYLGGCCLLYGLFVDGLCPTTSYPNGLAGYTYNYDDSKRYYLMNKSEERGLGTGLLYQRTASALSWTNYTEGELTDSAAWYIEYQPSTGYYRFKNSATGKYLSHASSISLSKTASSNENFQLMPDRTDVTIKGASGSITTHGYWFTWNASGNKSLQAKALGTKGYGTLAIATFDYADTATDQQWIIISEDELPNYGFVLPTAIPDVESEAAKGKSKKVIGIYSTDGVKRSQTSRGINIIRFADGTSKKVIF